MESIEDEKQALDLRRISLAEFMQGEIYAELPEVEQERLTAYAVALAIHSNALGEVITRFK